jgi:hypothetical protein
VLRATLASLATSAIVGMKNLQITYFSAGFSQKEQSIEFIEAHRRSASIKSHLLP